MSPALHGGVIDFSDASQRESFDALAKLGPLRAYINENHSFVWAYKQAINQEREAILDQLVADAQEQAMGYD
jgi:hypothetical protein